MTPQRPAAAGAVAGVRQRSRLAQWYPAWRLVSAVMTLVLGVYLPIGGYWWGWFSSCPGLPR